jgi:dihydrofolate synthase/folylpolyglutamate synthase
LFNTIDEVYNYLYNQKKTAPRENLDRITRCANLLNIKANYKKIHVAGTNGKGSTCQYIKEMLALKNLHVGMFVSPFVISFNERIQINDRYISDSEIMHYMNILYDFNQKYENEYNDHLPFFELTLLMALMWFSDRNIDIAIIECGLGGLLDSTNFLDYDLAIITNIGFDHMAQLGNTLEKIADHKLGIAKPNMTCLTTVSDNLKNHFINYAKNNNVDMKFITDVSNISVSDKTYFEYKNHKYQSNLLGEYQAYNASLAIEAVKYFDKDYPEALIEFALDNVKWPGRMEVLNNNPLILLDGAHNIHAINAITETLSKLKGNKKIKTIFSALQDKEYPSMIKRLEDITDYFYFTKIIDLRQIEDIHFENYTNKQYEINNDFKSCLEEAISNLKDDEILLITGSLHFVSQIREYYYSKKH